MMHRMLVDKIQCVISRFTWKFALHICVPLVKIAILLFSAACQHYDCLYLANKATEVAISMLYFMLTVLSILLEGPVVW